MQQSLDLNLGSLALLSVFLITIYIDTKIMYYPCPFLEYILYTYPYVLYAGKNNDGRGGFWTQVSLAPGYVFLKTRAYCLLYMYQSTQGH